MTLWQFELYKEYHQCNNQDIRYEIGREIVKANKMTPIPYYWLNNIDQLLPKEEWSSLNVPFFNSYVLISNHGRIKRLQRIVKGHKSGNPKNWPEKILVPSEKDKGRIRIKLEVDGFKITITPHRAVGLTFIPNPLAKPCINHIDGDPKNCHIMNLEWATYSENELHSHRVLGKIIIAPKGELSHNWKGAVEGYTHNGILFKKYNCVQDVINDGFQPSHVYRVANGVRKTTGGLIWKWA